MRRALEQITSALKDCTAVNRVEKNSTHCFSTGVLIFGVGKGQIQIAGTKSGCISSTVCLLTKNKVMRREGGSRGDGSRGRPHASAPFPRERPAAAPRGPAPGWGRPSLPGAPLPWGGLKPAPRCSPGPAAALAHRSILPGRGRARRGGAGCEALGGSPAPPLPPGEAEPCPEPQFLQLSGRDNPVKGFETHSCGGPGGSWGYLRLQVKEEGDPPHRDIAPGRQLGKMTFYCLTPRSKGFSLSLQVKKS